MLFHISRREKTTSKITELRHVCLDASFKDNNNGKKKNSQRIRTTIIPKYVSSKEETTNEHIKNQNNEEGKRIEKDSETKSDIITNLIVENREIDDTHDINVINENSLVPNVATLPNLKQLDNNNENYSPSREDNKLDEITIENQRDNNQSKRNKRVRFSCVHIQEYSLTVGDHPLCKGAFPLTLDWNHTTNKIMSIVNYERFLRSKLLKGEGGPIIPMQEWERRNRIQMVTGLNEFDLIYLQRITNRQTTKNNNNKIKRRTKPPQKRILPIE